MQTFAQRYAHLLVHYSLSLQAGERLLIKASTLAEPLVKEVYKEALKVGALPFTLFEFEGEDRILAENANAEQYASLIVNPLHKLCSEEFEAYLYIKAPYNLREMNGVTTPTLSAELAAPSKALQKIYFERTGDRRLKRNFCQWPTHAAAQEAGMSLEAYQEFVFNACKLDTPDPMQAWLDVRASQQRVVDKLNSCTLFQYKGKNTDIQFRIDHTRRWINSDGQTNMPSGEVYTSPLEDSVEGHIHFTYPVIFKGTEAEGITLWVEKGEVVRWEASKGQEILDWVFQQPGARRFGEAAIGTNYGIQKFTKNILFDEKIGGSVHMAIGQGYLQAGGKNESPIHWDMIADMQQGGEILADGEVIYRNGQFIF